MAISVSTSTTPALAFFQHADQDERPTDLTSPGHLAFECDAETQQGIEERLEAARQRQNAHADLRRWLAGDRTPNNDIRPHP